MNISYLLSSALLASSLSLYPITSNDVEKGFAVATVFPDIAARYFDTTDHKTTAALCHITTDALSMLNKGMFIYNNLRIQRAGGNFSLDRDIVVNSIWTARDLSLFIKHVHDLVAPQEKLPELDYDSETDRDEDSDGQEAVIDQANEDSEKAENDAVDNDEIDWLSVEKNKKGSADNNTADEKTQSSTKSLTSLEGMMSTVVIPVLKGYTAYALSWWQGPRHEDKLTRNIWVAAHSLTKLIDEYGMLDAKSSYKNGVIALIIINGIWLAKEIKNCRDHEAFVAEQARLRRAQEAERLRLAAEEERRRIAAVREAERLRREREAEEARRRGAPVAPGIPAPAAGAHQIDRALNLPPAEIINEDQEAANIVALIDDADDVIRANPLPQVVPPAALPERVGRCPVCMDDDIQVKALACGHTYCAECLQGHIQDQIRVPNIHCPNPACNHAHPGQPAGMITQGQIRAIINSIDDEEQRNNLTNIYNMRFNEARAALPGAVRCGRGGCNGVVINPQHRRANVACPECLNLICSNCGVEHGLDVSCYTARFNALDQATRDRIRRSENRILCPNCYGYLERNGACPHMTHQRAAGGCGHEFCLYCLKQHDPFGREDVGHEPWCQGVRRYFNNTPEGRGERVDPE